MNPRAEAYARLDGRYEVRVLEPSPPAVNVGPWFADDPVAQGEVPAGRVVVSPVATGDVRWEELAAGDGELAAWCSERWLGAYRRLGAPPPMLVPTRLALHRVAELVVSPARRKVNGKVGLRYTRGGFGTPFYGEDAQVRVADGQLIVTDAGTVRGARITTLAAAAELVGPGALPDDVELDAEPLSIDQLASSFLGDWYGFASSVLEELRADAGPGVDPSLVQLWPEHFDLAVELGAQAADRRAAYGLSPGDDAHPEPYLYVAPWTAPPPDELWQATGFSGAELPYRALLETDDQRATALDFFRARLSALTS
jgi:hypothetical protein